MTLLSRFHELAQEREGLLGGEADPFGVPVDEVYSATEARIRGRRVLMAGTNNYLGLTFHRDCVEEGARALQESGTGTTGSRMANGTYAGHTALEA